MDTQLFIACLALCGFTCAVIGYVVGCVETDILREDVHYAPDDIEARSRRVL